MYKVNIKNRNKTFVIFLSFLFLFNIFGLFTMAQAQDSIQNSSSLQEKAAHLEKILQDRHIKDGFVRELTLHTPKNPQEGGILHSSDNDGLWTALYVSAMSFKYAVTKDSKAKKAAKKGFRSLLWLEKITGVPGFPARSIVKSDELKQYDYDGEWHITSLGKWAWKGDTSSDELDGHFLAYALYYDLVADERERGRVEQIITRMMDHIITHDLLLVDVDQEPTRWGVWNPKQLNDGESLHGLPDEDWIQERGLNSLEILSHLKTAYHVTGNSKYQQEYMKLIKKHHYAENTLSRVLDPSDLNHSDVELAFCAYYPLLKYENDLTLSSMYRESLQKTWEVVKSVKSPWWNFTQCVFNNEDCSSKDSLLTLNSLPEEQLNHPLPPMNQSEIYTHNLLRWNGNPYKPNPGHGEIEGDGVVFLLPYWMGRHHQLIQ